MKSIGEFFTEVTDVDRGYFKTALALFRHPKTVVDSYVSGQFSYTKPLKLVLINASVHSLLTLLFGYFFGEDEFVLAWMPVKLFSYVERYSGFDETYFPFVLLVTAIPVGVLLVKMFFPRRTWTEVSAIMLYVYAQFWLIMIVFIPFPADGIADLLQPLFSLTVVFICFRKVFQGSFILSLGKWIFVGFLMILFVAYVSMPFTEFVFAKIVAKGVPQGEERTHPNPEIEASYNAGSITKPVAARNDVTHRLLTLTTDGAPAIVCLDNGLKPLWQLPVAGLGSLRFATKALLNTGQIGFVLLANGNQDLNAKDFVHAILVISEEGKLLYRKDFIQTLFNRCLVHKNTIIVTGGLKTPEGIFPMIRTLDFKYRDDSLNVGGWRTIKLPNPGQRFKDVYDVSHDTTGIELIVSMYENAGMTTNSSKTELNMLSVAKVNLDTGIHIMWETKIFSKKARYSPMMDEFTTAYDPSMKRIITSYSLADDSTFSSRIFCIDAGGVNLWQKKISKGQLTMIYDYNFAGDHIFAMGAIGTLVPVHPFFRDYGYGFVQDISDKERLLDPVVYGRRGSYTFNEPVNIVMSDSTMVVYSFCYGSSIFGQSAKIYKYKFNLDQPLVP